MTQRRVFRSTLAAVGLMGSAAMAAPPGPDPAGVWTIQDENASISTSKVTDRYYTNGLRLGYASPAGPLPWGLDETAGKLWGDGSRRWTFDLTQQIYTPSATNVLVPPKTDRPYAGLLLATFGLMSDTDWHRSSLSIGVGLVGPGAQGQEVQNGFHDLIGQNRNQGWASQLRDEPALQITSSRTYRLKLGAIGPLETDVLPELTGGIGTVRDYVEAGVTFRLGQGLENDFGVARVRPGMSGGDVFTPAPGLGWYVFAGVDGQGVARDITLDGDAFRRGPHVQRRSFIGEGQGGFGLTYGPARLTYTHVLQSQQFKGQKGGFHQFGSLALSVRF